MKKVFFSFLLATVPILFSFGPTPHIGPHRRPVQTIIIDPGHGGVDPGARGLTSTEADVALSVSLKLGDMITKEFPDIKIIYTRTTDVLPGNKPNKDLALRYRADLANQSNGDLFLCIHCNSAGKHAGGWYDKRVIGKTAKYKMVKKGKKMVKKRYYEYRYETYWVENLAKGTETYVWAVGKNEAKINSMSRINDEGETDSTSAIALPDPSDPAEKARMLIYAQNYFRKSLNLADMIENGFATQGRISRGVKQRNDKGIWVLQATGMPSVLVEIGFISNKEEEIYLNSDQGQADVVNNIFSAFKAYKQKQDSKPNTSQ